MTPTGPIEEIAVESERLELRPPFRAANLDRPQTGVLEGDLQLVGWLLADVGPAERVIVAADGRDLAHVKVDWERPDIAEGFPHVTHARETGFRVLVPAPVAHHLDELVLRAELGGESVPFWRVRLTRRTLDAPVPQVPPQRRRRRLWGREEAAGAGAAAPAEARGQRRAQPGILLDPFRVVAIISTFNEGDIIGSVLDHLERDGVWAYVIDTGSRDSTLEEIRARLGRNVIGLESMPPVEGRVSWRSILDRKVQLARELGADWYLHYDADEIRTGPWPGIPLRNAIGTVDRLGYNAIEFRVLNFPPVDDAYRPGDDPLTHFTRWEEPADYDRMQRKCWRGEVAGLSLEDGGHDVRFAGRRMFPLRFLLCHYPIRGQSHGTQKVLRDRHDRFIQEEIDYGWHRQYNHVTGPDYLFLKNPADLNPFDIDHARLDTTLEDGINATRPSDEDAAGRTRVVPEVRGVLERVSAEIISGWAVSEDGSAATVEVWDGGRQIARIVADQPRPDLAEHEIADGTVGGFSLRPPRELIDGEPHWIWVTSATTRAALRRSPLVLHFGHHVLSVRTPPARMEELA